MYLIVSDELIDVNECKLMLIDLLYIYILYCIYTQKRIAYTKTYLFRCDLAMIKTTREGFTDQ